MKAAQFFRWTGPTQESVGYIVADGDDLYGHPPVPLLLNIVIEDREEGESPEAFVERLPLLYHGVYLSATLIDNYEDVDDNALGLKP